jgi:hypothetical protein
MFFMDIVVNAASRVLVIDRTTCSLMDSQRNLIVEREGCIREMLRTHCSLSLSLPFHESFRTRKQRIAGNTHAHHSATSSRFALLSLTKDSDSFPSQEKGLCAKKT